MDPRVGWKSLGGSKHPDLMILENAKVGLNAIHRFQNKEKEETPQS